MIKLRFKCDFPEIYNEPFVRKCVLVDTLDYISTNDSDKKVYDTAMYTSKHAKERYKIIKEINNLKEFFRFRKKKLNN